MDLHISELWISTIELCHNSIMDLHNSIMDLHNSIMDLHNYGQFMKIHNWYSWISTIRIVDLHN